MSCKIIGFGHRSRVGKDTCGKLLNTELRLRGVKAAHVAFALKLKEVAFDLYGWAGVQRPIHYENHPEDRQKVIPALGMTYIELLVALGNKIREIYPETFVDLALRGQKNADVVIVTDVRYQNEVDRIHELGGVVYKVTCPTAPVLDTVADKALVSYTGWDGLIENDGTMNELNDKVKLLVEGLIA